MYFRYHKIREIGFVEQLSVQNQGHPLRIEHPLAVFYLENFFRLNYFAERRTFLELYISYFGEMRRK